MPTEDELMAKYRRQRRVTVAIVAASFVLIIGLVIGFAVIYSSTRPEPQGAAVITYDSYQAAWDSAMAKASVEATFPGAPVALVDVTATGMHTFSATFTGDEISAVLTMLPYEYAYGDGTISLSEPSITFPAEDTGSFDGRLVYGGTRYRAQATAPVTFEQGRISVSSAGSELRVEGFGVGGDRRDQALGFVQDYLNAVLSAAPHLTVEQARIVEGGVEVEGLAPDSLSFPTVSAAE